MKDLRDLKDLTIHDITHKNWGEQVMRIGSLQELFLSRNPITNLPPSITQLALLRTLALDGTRVSPLFAS